MNPLISIIVPVYNVELYLEECINSILKQTLSEIEIILVDDNSSDSSLEICNKFATLYNNIKVIHKKQNEGLGMACNTGIENANGDYIAFCDSDDFVDTDMYDTMLKYAQKYNCDAVFSGIKRVSKDGHFLSNMQHPTDFQLYNNIDQIHCLIKDLIASEPNQLIERKIQVSAKTVLYKKDIITKNKIKFVSERQLPSEDLIFNIDILNNSNRVCVIPKAFYNYRINTNSISQKVNVNKFKLFKDLYYYIYSQCLNYKINGDYNYRVLRMFYGYTRYYIINITSSSLPYKTKKNIFAEISKDEIWNLFWKTYPINKVPLSHRIFLYSIKLNLFFLINIITRTLKFLK